LIPTGCGFTAAGGDRRRRRGWRGRLRGLARFQPRLSARVLARVLALVLSRRLADIAAIALLRRGPRRKLVSERGQGVALAGAGLWLRTAGELAVLRIRPCAGPRSTIGLGL
jgi:hypothetical protein